MVELGLPLGFAVEVDALYNRFGYSSTTVDSWAALLPLQNEIQLLVGVTFR